MKISVIIVHWNTVDHLKNLLSRLNDSSMEVIVIDNNSSEKINELTTKYKNATFIKNEINHGYAMACNQGAAIAKGEWLLFLNPDVEVTPDQIMMMIEQAEEKNFVACSPKPESKDYQKTVPTVWSLLEEFTPLNKLMTNTGKVYTLTGGCLLIKSEILRKLGGWDERFFLWFEDSDLTKRLIDNTYKIGWIDTPVKHVGGASFQALDSQRKRDIFFHSMDVYSRKHFSFWGKLVISFIKKRYSKRKVLPAMENGVSITVPNMKLSILEKFFEDNSKFLNKIDELIIVTSAIKNDDVWDWRKKHPQVRFILLQKNKGVASTINVGHRVTATEWIGTVNDDTILSENWIEKCLECNAKDVGVLNPIIYHPNGEMESAGVKILKKGKAEAIKTIKQDETCVEADAVNAAIILYKNEALNAAGIFDEKFGSYLEDIDLSLRIKRNGWKNIICLHAPVTHIGQSTSSKTMWKIKPWLDFRNWFYVILKNWSISDLIVYSPIIIVERMRNLSGVLKSIQKSR